MERDANINKRICCARCATDQCSTRMISKRFRYIVYKLYMDEDCLTKHVRNKIRKQFFFLSSPCCILWTLFVLWFSLHFFSFYQMLFIVALRLHLLGFVLI